MAFVSELCNTPEKPVERDTRGVEDRVHPVESKSTTRRLEDVTGSSVIHKLESLNCILDDPKDL